MTSLQLKPGKFFTIYIVFFLFLSKSFTTCAQEPLEEKIPNVVIVTLNGVQNKDSIEDPTHQYIPNLWKEMFKKGVLCTNLVDSNFQMHMPAVNAIDTGKTYPYFHDNINTPSIFQYVRKRYALPAHKFWLIGNWFKGQNGYSTSEYPEDTYPCQMAFSIDFVIPQELTKILTKQEFILLDLLKELKKSDFSEYPQWSSLDEIYFHLLKKVIKEFKPKLVHYSMCGVECGHYDTFSQYLLALKRSDEKIFEIWQLVKNDPFYKDNTYLIVCVDHERNSYYMEHIENPPEYPSRVWMYIYGPDVKKGVVIGRRIHHIDIFATVAYLMDVETRPTEGKILRDCFSP